ncbi:MAG: roadblock/LC7 domain-containing protein [Flavobacteriaceae bacterium]
MNNLEEILNKLVENTNSDSALLVNSEGLTIASINADNEDRVAVMIASLHSMGEKFSSDLDKGTIEQFYIKTNDGYILLKDVNENTIIGLVAKDSSKLGLLMMYLDSATNEITALL